MYNRIWFNFWDMAKKRFWVKNWFFSGREEDRTGPGPTLTGHLWKKNRPIYNLPFPLPTYGRSCPSILEPPGSPITNQPKWKKQVKSFVPSFAIWKNENLLFIQKFTFPPSPSRSTTKPSLAKSYPPSSRKQRYILFFHPKTSVGYWFWFFLAAKNFAYLYCKISWNNLAFLQLHLVYDL